MADTLKDAARDVERERVIVRAQRQAFVEGAIRFRHSSAILSLADVLGAARGCYPMPRVERPRVACVGTYEYRISDDGSLLTRPVGDVGWRPFLSRKEVEVLSDLLAHPTETVSEDEDEHPGRTASVGA